MGTQYSIQASQSSFSTAFGPGFFFFSSLFKSRSAFSIKLSAPNSLPVLSCCSNESLDPDCASCKYDFQSPVIASSLSGHIIPSESLPDKCACTLLHR